MENNDQIIKPKKKLKVTLGEAKKALVDKIVDWFISIFNHKVSYSLIFI